jgi:orotidine-5'-phosphate decarboxylase
MAEIVVALDLGSTREALALVDSLSGLRWVKVGPTLFVEGGPQLIRELKGRSLKVFLDLKWHDIPHQVSGATAAAAAAGVDLDLGVEVARLARQAMEAGLDGVVASPLEIGVVRSLVRAGGWIVVPGIRPAGSDAGDQQRTAEPGAALRAGATHLVVGRPITQAQDPAAVFEALCQAAS